MAKTGGTCVICGYKFKPEDGKYWKTANICNKCADDLTQLSKSDMINELKQDKENGI